MPMLFYAGSGDLRQMGDMDWNLVQFHLQFAYAQQLDANGPGRLFASSSPSNSGSFVNTERTSRSTATHFPGTGTLTRSTFYLGQNTSTSLSANFNLAPMGWNGADGIERMDTGNLAPFFDATITQLLAGNQLGSYRIEQNTPAGGGWVDKGFFARDTIFSNSTFRDYRLWLRTGGVTAPAGEVPLILAGNTADATDIQRISVTWNGTFIQNFLLPLFSNYAVNNGLRYNLSTSVGGTIKGTLLDTRRSGTSNIYHHTDFYESRPTGGATNHQAYFLTAS